MLPFHVTLTSGLPIYEQVMRAIKRAIARGELKPGAALPSVRELSRSLQINPNTAQKVISALVNARLVEVRPGIGSVISDLSHQSAEKVELILGNQLETLIIDAATLGISEQDFIAAVKKHWTDISKG